jgi:hypothetical protein
VSSTEIDSRDNGQKEEIRGLPSHFPGTKTGQRKIATVFQIASIGFRGVAKLAMGSLGPEKYTHRDIQPCSLPLAYISVGD